METVIFVEYIFYYSCFVSWPLYRMSGLCRTDFVEKLLTNTRQENDSDISCWPQQYLISFFIFPAVMIREAFI